MSAEATISSAVLCGLGSAVAARHLDADGLARDCQLSPDVFSDDHLDVPLDRFVRFLERSAAVSGVADFGWQAGKSFRLSHLGELGEAVASAPTLGAALWTFARFLRVVQSSTELTFEVDGEQAIVSYRILDPEIWPRRQDAEFTLSIIHSVISRCLGRDWRPELICFEHRPARHGDDWSTAAGACCAFECDANVIALPVAALDRPMQSGCAPAWCACSSRLDRIVHDKLSHLAVVDRVEDVVFSRLGHARFDLNAIALELGLSPRSMHRHLRAEGTTFSAVLSDCRLRLAKFLLANGHQSLSEIALHLGYSDYTSFSRAFRLAAGQTPKAYRDRHLPAGAAS